MFGRAKKRFQGWYRGFESVAGLPERDFPPRGKATELVRIFAGKIPMGFGIDVAGKADIDQTLQGIVRRPAVHSGSLGNAPERSRTEPEERNVYLKVLGR